jgi:hypothetical protein
MPRSPPRAAGGIRPGSSGPRTLKTTMNSRNILLVSDACVRKEQAPEITRRRRPAIRGHRKGVTRTLQKAHNCLTRAVRARGGTGSGPPERAGAGGHAARAGGAAVAVAGCRDRATGSAESSRRYAFIVPWLRRWTPSRIYGPGSATMMEHRPAWIRQAQGDEAGALEAIGEAIRLRDCHWATTSGYPQPHPGSADSTPTGTSR